MKLSYKLLSEPIDFAEELVHILVIEDPKLYRRAILSMLQSEGETADDFLLSESDKILSVERVCDIVTDPFCIETAIDKKVIGCIHKELSQAAMHELFDGTAEIFSEIHRYLSSLSELSDKELCFDDQTDPAVLLHAFHVRPDMEGMSFCEKLLYYMDLVYEYTPKRLFVFCGLHSYLSEKETESFLCDVVYRKFKVLLLERHDCQSCRYAKKTILDPDFCEI